MGNYRTSVLFRFSKQYESLLKVLKNGIYPNYCEEDLSFNKINGEKEKFIIGIPMISFCDIPITLLDEHTSRYGVYGIGLTKEWGIRNGISPIFYVANDTILSAMHFHIQNEREIFKKLESSEFKRKSEESLIKGSIISEIIEVEKAKVTHEVNTHIIGYVKKYDGIYNSKPINNYEENEWRYLVPDQKDTQWMWTKEDYCLWRFQNGTNSDKPAPTSALISYGLRFTAQDIKYILVKNADFKKRIIEFIYETNSFGGNKIDDQSKIDLLSKVITLQQVKEDF